MPENSLAGSRRSTSRTSKRPSGEARWPALGNSVNGFAYTWTATLTNRAGNNTSWNKRIDPLAPFHSRNRPAVVMKITGGITLVWLGGFLFGLDEIGSPFAVAFSVLASQLLSSWLRCTPSIARAGSGESCHSSFRGLGRRWWQAFSRPAVRRWLRRWPRWEFLR